MKIRPTTVLLVLASVMAFSASARADAPESHVSGIDNPAPSGPRVELMHIDRPAGSHAAGVRRTRRLTEHRMMRERTRSARRNDRVEHRRSRPVASELAAHNDGI